MRRWTSSLLIFSTLLASSVAAAQTPPPPFGRIPKAKVRTIVNAAGGFQLEYPGSGNWAILPGPPGSVLIIGEYKRGDSLILIERVALTEPLAADEMATVADREARIVRQREPLASDIAHQVLDVDKRKVIVVQYTRPGLQGPERVFHYGVPQESALYRVICTVLATQAERYTPWFGHIAASIQPATPVKPRK